MYLHELPLYIMMLMKKFILYFQIGNMILKSMNYLIKILGNEKTTPKLNFDVNFDDFKCICTPSVSEICDQYCSILDLVSAIKTLKFA